MGYKAAINILKQADDLKPKVLQPCDLLNDSQAWLNQQQLQSIYHQVLVQDLEYALDKKVEQDLWNIGFKNHITSLQERARDKKNPRRSESQALLTWALESASGFYLTLLQELCDAFDIDLPFRRRGTIYGQQTVYNEQTAVPQSASCSYICQYCLVHLGDIARYRNQRRQAESFYKQAILVSPHSGHPYNQLALLEASQADKLSTVFYYIRGISVKNPFPASSTNLMNVLSAAVDKEGYLEKVTTKMTVNEYVQLFLCVHGHFQTLLDIKQAQVAVQSLNSVMTALVATQSFTKQELVKITVINLFAFTHLDKDGELTGDESKARDLVLQLIAGTLSAFLMPVYTLQADESLLEYYALPAVKFLMYFLKSRPDTLRCRVFKERMQIWPSLCKLVNAAQSLLIGFNYNKYSKSSLSEDRDLQGFQPLEGSLKEFNFKSEIADSEIEHKVRMRRIIDFARWLCDYDLDGVKLITKTENKGLVTFEAVLSQPDPTNDLLEEMKSLTVQEVRDIKLNAALEKKAGILKPQGSLEKSREEREVKITVNSSQENPQKVQDSVKTKRAKQNVVLQSIFKKMEESKQVKFNVEDPQDKGVKFDSLLQPPKQFNPNSITNPALRTQSFNQNHPAFPSQPNPSSGDYLTNLRNLGKGADNMMPQFSQKTPPSYPNLPSQPNQPPVKLPSFPPPFNVPPPHFNSTWNREDFKPPNKTPAPWWFGQMNNASGFSFQDNKPPFPHPPNQPPPPNFNAPFSQHHMPYPNNELFNSPWTLNNRNFGTGEEMNSSMSMRQAMLKEASRQEMPPSPGAYSLFNNSGWTPTLTNQRPGEFNGPQHSLFGGPGPQSLAQLLEHQQNQIRGANGGNQDT